MAVTIDTQYCLIKEKNEISRHRLEGRFAAPLDQYKDQARSPPPDNTFTHAIDTMDPI